MSVLFPEPTAHDRHLSPGSMQISTPAGLDRVAPAEAVGLAQVAAFEKRHRSYSHSPSGDHS